jgi:hypothetical protein
VLACAVYLVLGVADQRSQGIGLASTDTGPLSERQGAGSSSRTATAPCPRTVNVPAVDRARSGQSGTALRCPRLGPRALPMLAARTVILVASRQETPRAGPFRPPGGAGAAAASPGGAGHDRYRLPPGAGPRCRAAPLHAWDVPPASAESGGSFRPDDPEGLYLTAT